MFLLSLLDHYLFLRTHLNIEILMAIIHAKVQTLLKIMGAQPWTKAALLWLSMSSLQEESDKRFVNEMMRLKHLAEHQPKVEDQHQT